MRNDAFSGLHPGVNFFFFAGAIGLATVLQHPAFLAAGCVCAAVYYLLLMGKKGLKTILGLLPLIFALTAVNPLFNTYGAHILFSVFGRPYTLEALLYGGAVALMFAAMLLWFGCYNQVMTSDKFTALFGSLIPALSLVLVMVLRMVPNFTQKVRQITGARMSIGKGPSESAAYREKLDSGMSVLSSLTSWALEGSLVTADSMRSRGYGTAKRRSFQIYRMTARDWTVLGIAVFLLAAVITAAILGQTRAVYTPELFVAPVSWGSAAYAAYLLIPTVFYIKEAITWHILRSGI